MASCQNPKSHSSLLNSLEILQWNCHSISNKIDLFKSLLNDYEIIALSETWLLPSSSFNLQNFFTFRLDSSSRNSGGLLISIRKNISYQFVNNCFNISNKLQSIVITLKLNSLDLIIISIYRFPNYPLSLTEWENLET